MPVSKKRVAELAAMPDSQIDTSDIPEADENFFRAAKLDQAQGGRAGMGPSKLR